MMPPSAIVCRALDRAPSFYCPLSFIARANSTSNGLASYIPKSARICFFFYSKCHKIMYEAMHSCFTARKCHLLNPMLEFTYKNPTIHSNPFPHLENIQSSGASDPMLQFQLAMFCSSVCI